MPTLQERVTTLEADQRNHEQVCASRWGILIKLIGWGGSLAFVTVLGVAGFGLKSVYESQQHQLQMLQSVAAQVASKP